MSNDELQTVLVEVEAILNSHPISYLSSEGFEEPLSPSDTFLGHPFDPEFEETNAVMDLSHWMHHLNQILEHLWRQWRSEYLVGLRESHAYCGRSGSACRTLCTC